MVLILIFSEVLGLYGCAITVLLWSSLTYSIPDTPQADRGNHYAFAYHYWDLPCRPITACLWVLPFLMNDVRGRMDNVSITPHEFDTSCHLKHTFSIIILAVCGSPLLKVSACVSALKTETVNWRSAVFAQWNAILSLSATLNESVNWNGSRWTGICSDRVLLLLNVSDYDYDYFH